MNIDDAKKKLDDLLKKQRTHMYKPIQIAEILYHQRMGELKGQKLINKELYRTKSRKWRDDITLRLTGNYSTSSAKYQDNLFDENAIPPKALNTLALNNSDGIVENYIYHKFKEKQQVIMTIHQYIQKSTVHDFDLQHIINIFSNKKNNMRSSVDKIYEITVYALLNSILSYLNVTIQIDIKNQDKNFLKDFRQLNKKIFKTTFLEDSYYRSVANIHRLGVANAADGGLDIWSNFGPVFQVKHIDLKLKEVENIVDSVASDQIIIICRSIDAEIIHIVLETLNLSNRIQGIITLEELIYWYDLSFKKYKLEIGQSILDTLRNEIRIEFPYTEEIEGLLRERIYNPQDLKDFWEL